MGDLGVRVITWEAVAEKFADVGQDYFHAVLVTALRRYPDLVSAATPHQDDEFAGAKLVMWALAGDVTWPYMGRKGGLQGSLLSADLKNRTWATKVYQCRREPLPDNQNWFPVVEFITALRARGHDVDVLAPGPPPKVSPPG